MQMESMTWGQVDGRTVSRYLLRNQNGMEVEVSDFGALILAIRFPIGEKMRDIVLGYDSLEEYLHNDSCFGAYVGRNCNRLGGAKANIGGKVYHLDVNDRGNNLHSGPNLSFYKVYETESEEDCGSVSACANDGDGSKNHVSVSFSRISPDLEQGFPGNLQQTIRYTLTEDNALEIEYIMRSDQTTVINPTNHSYFNLMGHASGNVLSHRLTVYADQFLLTDDKLIPTGELASVDGTPMDFRIEKEIGAEIRADYQPLIFANGYDHNYCLSDDGQMHKAAVVRASDNSLSMTVETDRPGLQIYTGNFVNDDHGKDGAEYRPNAGVCFETQAYPNACNEESFPSSLVDANEEFRSKTIYSFQF